MKKITKSLILIIVGIVCVFSFSGCRKSYSASDIFKMSQKSICEITTYKKNGTKLAIGSGFVYSKDGEIVTNYHVIEDSHSATVTINDVTYSVVSVLAYDKDVDLAVLRVKVVNLPVLEICTEENVVGEEVYAIGSSRGLTDTFSQGIISFDDREIDGVHYIQHTAAISSGNSGGPLINKYGEVIGINTMSVKDSQNLNFAVSVKELNNLTYAPISYSEFYEKECDPFAKLRSYIMANGEYDWVENEYEIFFGETQVEGDICYETGAYYRCDTSEVVLAIFMGDDTALSMLAINIDVVDGIYEWDYLDTLDHYFSGIVYARSFNENSTLTYTSYSGTSYPSSFMDLCTNMFKILLFNMYYDYADIDVTAYDLLFVNFQF